VRRALISLLVLLLACVSLLASAGAIEAVSLHATIAPQRHNRGVTVGIDISMTTATPPSPPAELTIRYPLGLEIELGELGLDTCTVARIQAVGARGCPADSIMGYGSALAAVQVGPTVLHETARLTLVRAPDRDRHLAVLVDAEGTEPVIAKLLLAGLLLPANSPFGGTMQFAIPSSAGVSGGQNIALMRLDLILGPPDLIYYERLRGKTIAYHPKGIPLLGACPRDGLPFSATVRFLDGRRASARTAVRCDAPAARQRG
jgi:hypothetical protein